MMLKAILLGLDGSDRTNSAVDLAISWSRRFESLLVGMAVVDEPTIRGAHREGQIPPSYQMAYDMQMTEERRRAEQALEAFSLRSTEAGVASKVLEYEGRPCDKILQEGERYDAIVLGRNACFRAGSHRNPCETLEHVLRCTPRPVVVVPDIVNAGSGTLIAYDGSPQAARAVQLFASSGLSVLGEVHVATVHSDSSVAAARTADRAVEFLSFHGISATPHRVVTSKSVASAILEQAERLDVELLVMGAHSHSKLQEFLIGSVTCTALDQSKVPLFLYH